MLFLQNEQAFEEVFQNANFRSFTFRIRVKLETYNVSKVSGAEADGKLLCWGAAASQLVCVWKPMQGEILYSIFYYYLQASLLSVYFQKMMCVDSHFPQFRF